MYTHQDRQRFARYVDESDGLDACHPWIGGTRGKTGYGCFWHERKSRSAPRVAWEMANGPIPIGLQIRHDCDNRLCVNVRHLQVGTAWDNMHDRMTHGIDYRRGIAHHLAKLTPDRVLEAQRLRQQGWSTYRLAARYGISRSSITRAVNGDTWAAYRPKAILPNVVQTTSVTREQAELAIKLRRAGIPWIEVASAVGVPTEWIRKLLPKAQRYWPDLDISGIGRKARARKEPSRPREYPPFTLEQRTQVEEWLRLGLSWSRIGRHLGRPGKILIDNYRHQRGVFRDR